MFLKEFPLSCQNNWQKVIDTVPLFSDVYRIYGDMPLFLS